MAFHAANVKKMYVTERKKVTHRVPAPDEVVKVQANCACVC